MESKGSAIRNKRVAILWLLPHSAQTLNRYLIRRRWRFSSARHCDVAGRLWRDDDIDLNIAGGWLVLIRKYGDVYLARYHCVISIFELQAAGKSSAEIAKGPSVRSRACTCKSMFVCLFVMCVPCACVCVCVYMMKCKLHSIYDYPIVRVAYNHS